MEEKQAGVTALITAYARAYHATHDSPKIFDDFLADQLYTPEEHRLFDQNLAGLLPMIDPELAETHPDQQAALARVIQRHNGPITLSRSRYTEDSLLEAVRQGVTQYVILGAGFDTFAFRWSSRLERLQVFEIDHPVTQQMKRDRIANAGWALPDQLHFIPLDFNRNALIPALLESGYNPRALSFFSWLGVTYYLPDEVVTATLRDVAAISSPGSRLVFDYMDADAFIPGKAGERISLMQRIAGMVGEPMKTGFDPLLLESELAQAGFQLQEDLGPAEIERRYFMHRADDYHAFEHVHFAQAAAANKPGG